MVDASVLRAAKAFLCWDMFDDLGVQLVPLRHPVAYFYPRHNPQHAIVLFYTESARDMSEALFLLFHEAGHVRQWLQLHQDGQDHRFAQLLNLDKGAAKYGFEQEAWTLGRALLEEFLRAKELETGLLDAYDQYGRRCLESYKDRAPVNDKT